MIYPPIEHVGYIGMGIMGSAMAANLLKADFKVTVFNRTAAKCEPLRKLGAAVADSPAGVVRAGPQVVCINVTDTPDVEHVLFGADGISSAARPGLIIVDHSTISPEATRAFAAQLAKQNMTLLDAPVSGGDVGAKNGTLSIMVGGPAEAFAHCMPMFERVGRAVTHMGDAGLGQVCKACNQVAVAVNLLGVCEAMALAKKSGLDLEKMIQVLSAGAAGSWQIANLGPRIAKGDMAPGFMVDLVLKDLAIVAGSARHQRLPLNATALAEGYFRGVQAHGGGKQGTQAISQVVESLGDFRFKA
ncbi:MAG: NAD(P)-dependent oxidoreductase [Planctomycetes bacterium]|nr:NAD(P)-dependent oxidoreductase [Planctomycetota bacterium]